jgi:serine/threonine protein kinase
MTQLAKAAMRMNELGIIHGDHAPPNVLLDRLIDETSTIERFYREGAVLADIIDLGGSGYRGTIARVTHDPISAPEIAEDGGGVLDDEVDIYSFCYIALQILNGRSIDAVDMEDAEYQIPMMAAMLLEGRLVDPSKRPSWTRLIKMLNFSLENLLAAERENEKKKE